MRTMSTTPSSETLHKTKKTFYYNFFPTKPKEEEIFENPEKRSEYIKRKRSLVEIRDDVPRPEPNPNNTWTIKRALTKAVVDSGKIVLSMSEAFEHVLRHWSLDMAKLVTQGLRVETSVCDVTQSDKPTRHEGFLKMNVDTCEFDLVCVTVMKDRSFKVDDDHVVSLFWDSDEFVFKFKITGSNN